MNIEDDRDAKKIDTLILGMRGLPWMSQNAILYKENGEPRTDLISEWKEDKNEETTLTMHNWELADYIREAINELEDTQDLLREARDVLLSEQEPSSPWQPIETAPKDGTWLIGRCKGDGPDFTTLISREAPEHWRGLDSIGIRYVSPTHWMPLPNPPSP